ncbi:aspartate/glutamate racemase family protein [Tardiphaga sp. 42S5]|uniref:aspartate/glutamate racemase family protein n=1 Tax=Tardiphaga sp. 42S5 TaxID=1404799 RepID=UPI002A59CA40|nr:aspartate/glutamate racemase family protein [Tardiphaga sp. 42S5]WPO41538.1 aspartate/glutamate racemase family protein [Tardiphaga sp. 42S5]
MRTIGLLGGMSWESTAVYYRRINEQVRRRMGGLHSAKVIMHSVDFERIVSLQKADAWDAAGDELASLARGLETAGADCVLICTNTMHKLADIVQGAVSIPLLHITDETGSAVRAAHCRRPLLLATRYTMEQDFYLARLRGDFGLSPMVPDAEDRAAVHGIIFGELCCGLVRDTSRQRYLDVIARAKAAGADSVILGCTEIGLLIGQQHFDLPAFDSTLIHADAAVAFALDREDTPQSHAA